MGETRRSRAVGGPLEASRSRFARAGFGWPRFPRPLGMRFEDFDEAVEIANRQAYGNGACIFTQSGRMAREFAHRIKAGMVGVNVGVPAPLAYFPFSGWDHSFYGDLHMQGREGVAFYTRQKVVTTRWHGIADGEIWHQD